MDSLSIIICTHNRPQLLSRLLDALANQTIPPHQFDLVVVDDGSKGDETAQICKDLQHVFPKLTYISVGKHVGLASARTIGVESTKTEALLFTDDDCVPTPDWVARMAAALEKHPIVAGAVDTPFNHPVQLCHNIAEFYGFMPCGKAGPTLFLAGANMAVRRTTLNHAGGFKKGSQLGEDISFILRAREKGYIPWFTPDAVVVHAPDRKTVGAIFGYASSHAERTIQLRNEYQAILGTPIVLRSVPLLIAASPLLALAVTAKVYFRCPSLLRFWWTIPVVYALKLAWCMGAIKGLRHFKRSVI